MGVGQRTDQSVGPVALGTESAEDQRQEFVTKVATETGPRKKQVEFDNVESSRWSERLESKETGGRYSQQFANIQDAWHIVQRPAIGWWRADQIGSRARISQPGPPLDALTMAITTVT